MRRFGPRSTRAGKRCLSLKSELGRNLGLTGAVSGNRGGLFCCRVSAVASGLLTGFCRYEKKMNNFNGCSKRFKDLPCPLGALSVNGFSPLRRKVTKQRDCYLGRKKGGGREEIREEQDCLLVLAFCGRRQKVTKAVACYLAPVSRRGAVLLRAATTQSAPVPHSRNWGR